MIVVDTSALVAIYRHEPEAESFAARIEQDGDALLAAPNFLEFLMVQIGRQGPDEEADVREFLAELPIAIAPWDEHLANVATDAFVHFGKGRHPAGLNFGDCMAYALAKSLDIPLLYKGKDFAQTDIESAA